MGLSVEVEDARSGKIIANVDRLQSHATIADVKARIAEKHSKYYVERLNCHFYSRVNSNFLGRVCGLKRKERL